jgi:hypothetical protein
MYDPADFQKKDEKNKVEEMSEEDAKKAKVH